ncbi:MAG: SUMF1/EgtB/PvdO family nonheme iron enzyme [Candidatus Sumerlaeota bacterium]|nr:SUMF1/EgtB/PvdO family nonheme iron enzyme [Candidatus Sumerlaeota bacterium]
MNNSWPKFLHPYPLSDKYFLVSMQPDGGSPWGIYLVDIYDNLTLVREEPGYALFEPLPLRKTPRPAIVPDHVDLSRRNASVYLNDIYVGKGLEGVPRGTVKKLRIYEFHYAYPRMGGHSHIGIDGPWDVHRIHGTVPVEVDGSANFRVPANTPIAVQPLDSEGRSLQLMRSWFTAMPGETLSCVGCHESQNSTPPSKPSMAMSRPPSEIAPWYGPARGFSFAREVQPVLDKYCVGCHNGEKRSNGKTIANFRGDQPNGGFDIVKGSKGFTASYMALHPFVRRPGPESDYFMQKPLEYHPSTCELAQMLTKGHHGVKLNTEAWDRLYTWIDLNVPDHGTWTEHRAIASPMHERRLEMRTRYANRPEDPEAYPTSGPAILASDPRYADSEARSASSVQLTAVANSQSAIENPQSGIVNRQSSIVNPQGWPFDAAEATKRQAAAGAQTQIKLDLGNKVDLDLALIPAGEFAMGDLDGCLDERPMAPVKIEKPFYMGRCEVTNAQYALFDPAHDSAYISVYNKDQSNRGEIANRERQPVIRITWREATAYCEWLSKKTGRKFSLPTEAQWEYACRAGTATPLSFGDCAVDFGKLANLADQRVNNLCRGNSPKWIPSVPQVNDGAIVTEQVGKYQPNAWGLCDMHGNVWEWTRTTYKPYPYDPSDGRDSGEAEGAKVVRGGSFYDRPLRARSAFRLWYPAWQCVYSVGFRVVCETEPSDTAKK